MHQNAPQLLDPVRAANAFEHSITQEDDIWRADPCDIAELHLEARRKFEDLIDAFGRSGGVSVQGRILLFHGEAGVGKTHLIRALRTSAHRQGKAYFGYAQMSPDVGNYADYFLRRLIVSLERPYDPDRGGESGLSRLTRRFMQQAGAVAKRELATLCEAKLSDTALAELVHDLADRIIASPSYKECGFDVNVIRALLYLQRADPRIDQRVRSYLQGRQFSELSRAAVAALDPATGEAHAFDIIEALGKLMWSVDKAALVLCADQMEDMRFFADPEERLQRAVRDLIQIVNRVPTAIVILSSLQHFYEVMREKLPQSYTHRIEKAGHVEVGEINTPEVARLVIRARLSRFAGQDAPDPCALLGEEFFEGLAGLSTRKLLELAEQKLRAMAAETAVHDKPKSNFIDLLASALGGTLNEPVADGVDGLPGAGSGQDFDYTQLWERHQSGYDAELPQDDAGLLSLLETGLRLARSEAAGVSWLDVREAGLAPDLPALDMILRHEQGLEADTRVFLCNRATQGGGLKRQLDKVLEAAGKKTCFLLRTTDFPQGRKNQTVETLNTLRNRGGRLLKVPLSDWERMMCVRDFYECHRYNPAFLDWFAHARLLTPLPAIAQLLRLDLLAGSPDTAPEEIPAGGGRQESVETAHADGPPPEPEEEEPPMEGGILAGTLKRPGTADTARPLFLDPRVFKRHAAFLGGSGSGKTTLALSLIEQLLLAGIPAVLIDRKGDLASYANPDAWRTLSGENAERHEARARLAASVDVAVYTPGRVSGRPISITLLPNGIAELPEQEQQSLANLSAAALGDMLHLKTSATHQKQSGTLAVALRVLGSRHRREVTLADLIAFLEDEDPELTEATQRMDPTGKFRRELVAQLDSLRHRNTVLFEGGGEPLRMDALLGVGRFARKERTRLSVIYTGFLGDNENILFWVAQFLSEALRFCQKNPHDELQAVVMFDEADLYIPANSKPATADPLQSLLKRARSAGLGVMLATQSPGDLDYRSRDQITSWFIGRVREDTALRKLKAAFQSESGLDPAAVLPNQTVGEFHLVQEGKVRPLKAQRSLISAEQVPFDRIEQLARRTKGQDESQLRLFDTV